MRLIDYFERGLRYYPERACLIDTSGKYTYREVNERSHRAASALLAGGLQVEDTVAILSPNGAPAFQSVDRRRARRRRLGRARHPGFDR